MSVYTNWKIYQEFADFSPSRIYNLYKKPLKYIKKNIKKRLKLINLETPKHTCDAHLYKLTLTHIRRNQQQIHPFIPLQHRTHISLHFSLSLSFLFVTLSLSLSFSPPFPQSLSLSLNISDDQIENQICICWMVATKARSFEFLLI